VIRSAPIETKIKSKYSRISCGCIVTGFLFGGLQPSIAQNISPSMTFNYTGSTTVATINTGGRYQLTLTDAAGGAGYDHVNSISALGGGGAKILATINLTAGTILNIVLGGKGRDQDGGASSYAGGGGGGSFVSLNGTLLLAAGGGGGAGSGALGDQVGRDGVTSTAGGAGGGGGGAGGTNGSGGLGPSALYAGGGGGGSTSNGSLPANYNTLVSYGFPGSSLSNGAAGGNNQLGAQGAGAGGFGGGGGGGFRAGGGGGGYSGGGGGGGYSGGGGGGSYASARATSLLTESRVIPETAGL